MAQVADSEWVEWAGGKCPVPATLLVEAKLRDGFIMIDRAGDWAGWNEPETPENSNWMHDGSKLDIIAYRVVSA